MGRVIHVHRREGGGYAGRERNLHHGTIFAAIMTCHTTLYCLLAKILQPIQIIKDMQIWIQFTHFGNRKIGRVNQPLVPLLFD